MICRDLIKDIKYYSYGFLKLLKDENISRWNKVKRIKNKLSSLNKIECLNSNKKKLFSDFISFHI
jgi:hypothetical protein